MHKMVHSTSYYVEPLFINTLLNCNRLFA